MMISGSHALMETLLVQGVQYVFGNPGTTESPLMMALEAYPQIEFILGLQETGVVHMADGYARASGRVGFAHLHISGGLANGLSAIYNAYRGGTPLVITAGQSDTRIFQEEPALWADLVAMAHPFTKWSTEVLHTADIPMVMSRAFKVASAAPSGPVFVSLPMNVLEEIADVQIPAPTRSDRGTRPAREALSQAADLLAAAEHPLILVGDRLAQSGGVSDAVQLAELLGAPVWVVNPTETNFPTNHPLFHGALSPWAPFSRDPLHEADVVLAVGANVFNPFMAGPRDLFTESTRLLHLDSSAWEIGRVYPAHVGMQCDPKTGLHELCTELEQHLSEERRQVSKGRLASARLRKAEREQVWAQEERAHWHDKPISPLRLVAALRELWPQNGVLMDEALTTAGPLRRAIQTDGPGTFFSVRGGAIGWACGAAVGAKLARSDAKVVAVIGDGSMLYTIQALWTAAHHRLPVTYIVCNNHSYRILKVNLIHHLGEVAMHSKFIGLDLNDPEIDFTRLAEGFGVKSWRVRRPDKLRPALEAALSSDGPSLVDVEIDGSL